jgi:hypothetical protein
MIMRSVRSETDRERTTGRTRNCDAEAGTGFFGWGGGECGDTSLIECLWERSLMATLQVRGSGSFAPWSWRSASSFSALFMKSIYVTIWAGTLLMYKLDDNDELVHRLAYWRLSDATYACRVRAFCGRCILMEEHWCLYFLSANFLLFALCLLIAIQNVYNYSWVLCRWICTSKSIHRFLLSAEGMHS